MKHKKTLLVLALAALSFGCGEATTEPGSSTGTSTESSKRITNPEELPSDEAGLKKVYNELGDEIATLLEGIETEEDLEASFVQIEAIGPAMNALMKRSEDLDIGVDPGSEEPNDIGDRISAASKKIVAKFPTQTMALMNAISTGMGQGR
ncbi:MAG: hypothetical protein GY711_21345 [bacterium]|nr:hypothetical protein [bacterium]